MLRELEIPEEWVHEIVRKKILREQENIAQMSREHPELVKAELFKGIKQFLPDDYDIDQHFTPSYRPWHQRIAFVPDGDLFKRIADGTASVVTDEIQTFQSNGILLKSGDVLEADVIITATGFNLNVLGDIDFDIDSEPLNFSESITYRGAMFTGIPNMAWVFGYFRASWTLRADLIGDFVCRLLNHMDEAGSSVAVPELREEDKSMKLLPWVDPEDFNPGYLQRSVHLLPKQGDTDPWRHAQDYWTEKDLLPIADLDDGALRFR
jgi:cation diffusion facilitator CzcD-associated flavoprotein CzcO